jgi:hypothetical protein
MIPRARERSDSSRLQLGGFGFGIFDVANQVERLLRQVIQVPGEDLLEALDRVGE